MTLLAGKKYIEEQKMNKRSEQGHENDGLVHAIL